MLKNLKEKIYLMWVSEGKKRVIFKERNDRIFQNWRLVNKGILYKSISCHISVKWLNTKVKEGIKRSTRDKTSIIEASYQE